MVQLIYKRIDELHSFWEEFLLVIEDLHIARKYELYLLSFKTLFFEVVPGYPDFLRRVSPILCGIAPTVDTILKMEDEEEKEEELRKIIPLVQEEVERLWNNIEEIIIDSYEDVLCDATDSEEIREIYRREVVVPIMEEMEKNKKEKIEMASWLNDILHVCITELFEEIEKLVMGG
ncbi:MAG: hypothetical protein N2V75_00365 [Methanophagales archaeon]|nr:hypothetical protein [Methanophagales archaeon]